MHKLEVILNSRLKKKPKQNIMKSNKADLASGDSAYSGISLASQLECFQTIKIFHKYYITLFKNMTVRFIKRHLEVVWP